MLLSHNLLSFISISNYLSHYVEDKLSITSFFHMKSTSNNIKVASNKNSFLKNDTNQPKFYHHHQHHNLFNSPRHYILIVPSSKNFQQKKFPSQTLSSNDALILDLTKLPINNNTANHYTEVILHEICSNIFKVLHPIPIIMLSRTFISTMTTPTEIMKATRPETETLIQHHTHGKNHHDKNIAFASTTTLEKDDSNNNNNKEKENQNVKMGKYTERDAFNLYNGNKGAKRVIAKLNQFSNFPVISQQVINDCPISMNQFQKCLFKSIASDQGIVVYCDIRVSAKKLKKLNVKKK